MEASQIWEKSMESKQDIRKRILARRSAMSEEEWSEKSCLIAKRVIEHAFFLCAEEIYCYIDCRREAGTRAILRKAWELGKKIAVPRVNGSEMEFYYVQSLEELEEGYFHIPEPKKSCPLAEGEHVLVILPGAAFDKSRSRIGYGKGFYDRYLEKHAGYRTMAAAFEFQVLDGIPSDRHDIRPEIIVTEEKIYV